MSPEAADLIKQLLVLDPEKRLGANDVSEIKKHAFFKDINWETLRKQQAPIIPQTKGENDTDNFVRMREKITAEEKENPFGFQPTDIKAVNNAVKIEIEFLYLTRILARSQENVGSSF